MPKKKPKKSQKIQDVITTKDYKKLVALIRREMARGIIATQNELVYQKKLTYHNNGKHITEFLLKDTAHADLHGTGFYERLSKELGINDRTIIEMVQFYKMYPNKPQRNVLSFSHYILLTKIKDDKKRECLRQKILKENMTSGRLRLVYKDFCDIPKLNFIVGTKKLKVVRGKLYHYSTKARSDTHKSDVEVEIDCGFSINIDKPTATKIALSKGKVVVSTKIDDGYVLRLVKNPDRDELYTYLAYVERVVDADTIIVKIDCGFGVRMRQRLRLRSIDAPELYTQKGDAAKKFVVEELAKVPFVVIKTYGSDKYDRYLVDVFYTRGGQSLDPQQVASQGKLLNQELLDRGFATIYK
ncbi:MAG: thermonuclease family protein [Candidatus Zapsychrus exili]|nr:thermonuclease family protein [Candidatus Zapsychrus exili]